MIIKKISIKKNWIVNYLTLISIFTFLIPGEIRYGVLGRQLGLINYISLSLVLYMVFKYIKQINMYFLIFYFITLIYYLTSALFYEKSIGTLIVVLGSYFIPLILIGLKINSENFKQFFEFFLKIFNSIVIFIVVLGVLDYFWKYKIISSLSFLLSPRTEELVNIQSTRGIYRLYSFMGHPLYNTQLFLMFYVLNMLKHRYYTNTIKIKYILAISLIGISLTASKTGFILVGVLLLIFNSGKKNYKYYTIVILVVLVSFLLGMFDNTILRLSSESLSTGRNEIWETISKNNLYPFKYFTGYGHSFTYYYNKIIPWASAAFEYPIRMFSLELGIINALLIYFFIFIYPIYFLLKGRDWRLLVGYLIIFIDVNTYNGLSNPGDNMLVFSIFIFIVLNLQTQSQNSKNKIDIGKNFK